MIVESTSFGFINFILSFVAVENSMLDHSSRVGKVAVVAAGLLS